ncbi:hypothetical protein ACFL5E_04360, partial [Candidatus Omnitrophota bacterium]
MTKLLNTNKLVEIATRKETVSVLLILVFLAAALVSIFVSPQLYQWRMHEGDIALKTTYAPYDFIYYWEIDEDATAKSQKDMAITVPFYISRDLIAEEEVRTEIEDFFDMLEEEQQQQDVSLEDKVLGIKDSIGDRLPERNIRIFLEYPNVGKIKSRILKILDNVFLGGYISEEDLKYVRSQGAEKVNIYSPAAREIQRNTADLFNKDNIAKAIDDFSDKEFPKDRKIRQAAGALVAAYLKPNLVPDKDMTGEKIQEAVSQVEPVYHSWIVKKNELIIEKGERVNARHIAQISQIRNVFRPGTTPTFFFGVLLLFFLLGLIATIHSTFMHRTDFLKNTKEIAITLLCMFIMIILSDFIMRSPQPSYFIPLASMGMIIALLVNFNVGFLCVVLMSVLISLLIGGKIEVTLVLMVGSVVGMFVVKEARRRGQILWAGLLVGVAKFLGVACIGLINGMGLDFYLRDGFWGIASGILSGIIVMGLLPLFEHIFKVPTNISLLELSDLNHPLLKRMALEAPGTYHHSI